MPFNIASIKDKAISAKNATASKFHDTRDKYSSTPMAKTRFADAGYVPDARKAPPPPPPVRSHASHASVSSPASAEGRPRPPPVARFTKPTSAAASPSPSPPPPARAPSFPRRAPWKTPSTASEPPEISIDSIDWANLSPEDKQVFFGWLDEFFARFLDGTRRSSGKATAASRNAAEEVGEHVEELEAPALPVSSAVASRKPPPMINSWSKPVPKPSVLEALADFTMSYPPPTTYGSQAVDLAYYFHTDVQWDTMWYENPGALPPPLEANPHRLYVGQLTAHGDVRTVCKGVLFGDLSLCWFTVTFSASNPARLTERTAQYLPLPRPLDRDALVAAHKTYGETIASFAEGFLGSGTFCARGECWDLAAEALKCFAQYDYVDAPVPSMNRTHGHLIFEGKALGGGRQVGRWRGDDDCVRRGDIVEWRSVRIGVVGAPPGSHALLGDPEHTAVITRDAVPASAEPHDGANMLPSALGALEVIEQSRNQPPEPVKRVYDMTKFAEGEVWIYRPVSMQVYLGVKEVECSPPPQALSV